MDARIIHIGILDYPGSLKSAVYGLGEMLTLASRVCEETGYSNRFEATTLSATDLAGCAEADADFQAIIVPPSLEGRYYEAPDAALTVWLRKQAERGCLLCSACAGAFILAAAGLLEQRPATTHWNLAEAFARQYPGARLQIGENLINDGNIICAGGVMAWLDLGLELVAQFSSPAVMHRLGAYLIVDTARREQRYYDRFSPRLDHGDKAIVKAQSHLQQQYRRPMSVSELAWHCHLTERTFLRRFVRATGLKPTQYLQRLRIQKACELIESSRDTFGTIAWEVGYEDLSAFRKVFVKVTGLTPSAFRQRFYRA